jgi:hypothetical protein
MTINKLEYNHFTYSNLINYNIKTFKDYNYLIDEMK